MSNILRSFLYRLGAALIVMIGISMLIFAIARVMPGDPARIALGPNATAEQVAALRLERHLDAPLPVQYWEFVKSVATGDLGKSLYTNRPVTTDIAQFLPATLELVFVSGILMILIGLPIGILSAHYRGRFPDHVGRLISLLGVCTPAFVWGVILQLVLGYFWGWFPIEGQLSQSVTAPTAVTGFMLIDMALAGNGAGFFDALHHLILPALALAMSGLGQTARLTRSNMNEVYERPYVEMARAYGFPGRRIAMRYGFRPALIPTLTILGLEFAAMLGNAFLVEKVFGWPGLSRYGVEVILRKDLDAIVGTVLVIAAAFLIVNIIVDILVNIINPRIRLAAGRA